MVPSTAIPPSIELPPTGLIDAKAAKILARTLFRDMKSYGIPNERILEVASELIGLVTHQLKEDTADLGS